MLDFAGLFEISSAFQQFKALSASHGWIWALFASLIAPLAVYAAARLIPPSAIRAAGRAVSVRLAGVIGKKAVDTLEDKIVEPFVEGMREDNVQADAVAKAWEDDTKEGPRG